MLTRDQIPEDIFCYFEEDIKEEKATTVHNFHPCCKPIDIMEDLLQDVPIDPAKPVLDPFVGSGATGIACLRTGHPFIGIDKEMDYLKISDARIRYWSVEDRGWLLETEIVSDAPQELREIPTLDFWGSDDE
ncbi:MAG: DNA methyltransferase [Bacteroidota bacterium]